MESNTKLAIASLLSAIVVALLCGLLWGCYYEEYQSLFHAFLSQKFSPGVLFDSWYYQGYIGISSAYAHLYLLLPHVEWLSWISYTYMVCAAALFLFVFLKTVEWQPNSWPHLFIVGCFALFLLADQVILLQNSRVAYLLSGAAMLCLIVHFYSINQIKKHPLAFGAIVLMYTVGLLHRLEPAMGVVYLMVPFAWIWHRNLAKTLVGVAVPVVLTVGLFVLTMVDLKTSKEFHKQVEPDIEMQLTVRNNIVPIGRMPTALDSLKYEAAKNMLWSDPRVITVSFLRSLIEAPPYSSVTFKQTKRALQNCSTYFAEYPHYVLLTVLLLALSVYRWVLRHQPDWAALGGLLGFVLVFVAGVFLQTYFVKMRPWAFSPFYTLFLAAGTLLVVRQRATVLVFTWRVAIVAVLVAATTALAAFNTSSKQKIIQAYKRSLQEACETASGQVLLLNPSSYQYFLSATKPFVPFDFSAYYRVYFYESQIASILPGYRDYLARECHCDVYNFSQFYRYLLAQHHPGQVYALSTEKRMNLIARYLQGIHKFELEYVPVSNQVVSALPGNQSVVLYRLNAKSGEVY